MARATKAGWWVAAAAVLAAALLYGTGGRRGGDDAAVGKGGASPVGAPAGTYVGTQKCAECHPGEHATYLETTHSRSFGEIDLAHEPPPGSFRHAASGRRYEVRREGTAMRHREWLDLPDGAAAAASEYAVRYLVGSGRHARAYLIEDDGFLAESPITWYQSRRAWGVSPGYDNPMHEGFERAVDLACLFCHAGRVETVGVSDSRMLFHEQAIGCERCHGPGEAHVEKHGNRKPRTNAEEAQVSRTLGVSGTRPDVTKDKLIVHPGRLPRALAEAICAECHLAGEAMVLARGKKQGDFRPGSPLSSYRADYRLDTIHAQMKVVGHVEQMRLSRCYRETQTLTCTTCHDPHGAPAADERLTHYRRKCLECHTVSSCGLKEAERLRRQSRDNCVACHMPVSATDVPHVASTHHRIGLHEQEPEEGSPAAVGTLVPYDDLSQWSEAERERALGMAYLELAARTAVEPAGKIYRGRSRVFLERCRQREDVDGEALAALARLQWEERDNGAIETAWQARDARDLRWRGRTTALFLVGQESVRLGQPALAIEPLEQLVKIRRHSQDWLFLGISRARTGDLSGGVTAVRRAAEIHPFREEIRGALADLLRRTGDTEAAAREAATAEALGGRNGVGSRF